jgi:GNAT superfamily N-acetyltransferase
MIIRKATEHDVPSLLPLMRGLAEFEGYIDTFAVTEDVLVQQGFRRSPPDFFCLVAAEDKQNSPGELWGMLVYYFIPFTAAGLPILYIKELFVTAEARGKGVGTLLMKAAAKEATSAGCAGMKWQVARWNDKSIRFYERLGAYANPVWVDFNMSPDAMEELIRP